MGWFRTAAASAPAERVEPRIVAPRASVGLNSAEFLGGLSDQGLTDFFRGQDSGTFGPPVTETNAMRISTVFACVNLAAGLVSSAPLGVYRDTPDKGRVLATNHRLYKLLNVTPFPGRPMTSATWRQLWLTHVWLWGNHFSIIRYDNAMRVVGFQVVNPWMVDVAPQPEGYNLYIVRDGSGAVREVVHQEDMLHFSGPCFDGIRGLSRIQQFARDPIALAKILEEQTGRVHENAARPSGMVTFPPSITKEGKDRMEANFNQRSSGRANAGRIFFGDKDSVFTPLQMSPEDLNTLEARRFQSADICRFFGTPPHLVGEAANTSAWGSGIEQLTLGYKQFTMHPQMFDFEQELALKLFSGINPDGYFAQFDRSALVVMDAITVAQVRQTKIQSGMLTLDEGRHELNLPAFNVPGSSEPLVNATMVPLSRAMTAPALAGDPAPTPLKPAKKG